MEQAPDYNTPASTKAASLDKLKQTLLKLIIGGWLVYAVGMAVIALADIPSAGVAKVTMTGYMLGLFSFTAYASTRARTRKDMEIVGIIGTGVSILAMLLGFAFVWIIADAVENSNVFAQAMGVSMVVALSLAHCINLAFLRPGHSLTNPFKYVTVAATALFGVAVSTLIIKPENWVNFSMWGGLEMSIIFRLIVVSLGVVFSGTICTVIFAKYLKAAPPPAAEEIDRLATPEG
jgi:hypothetical protein